MSEDRAPEWQQGRPQDCLVQVVPPLHLVSHVDEDACARKLNGYDAQGRRCYVRHDHTLVVQVFDIDEFPLAVALQHERRTAWRLRSGPWLMSVDHIDRLDSCKPRVANRFLHIATEASLGL